MLIVSISVEPSMSTFFLTSTLPVLLTTLHALSIDSISRLNVILTVFGIITWFYEPCGISISMFWLGYHMFGMLTLTMCSLLPLKVNCVLCSTIGSNSPNMLIAFYLIYNIIMIFYDHLQMDIHCCKNCRQPSSIHCYYYYYY